jgi:signal transduction histidine kinase/HAMP domain-containing protein
VALAALTYAVSFAIRYVANLPGELEENQIYYLLTPVTIGLTVLVFFRRSIHWSAQAYHSSETTLVQPSFKSFFKPGNRAAVALRNYGLSLAIGLVPVVALIAQMALPGVLASFLFNFGTVIAIAALMVTYFNYAPESVTISAKLVGISLVSVLLILGLAGVWVYHTNPGLDEHSLVSTFIGLVLISSLLIISIFPFFYRTALLDPLEKLLKGVKVANEGDLNIQVAVQYEDEIGFLTQSFNRMISSLYEATQALKDESAILERQVAERITELRELNQQLVSENFERKTAQAMLDRQLRYEQALAGCSESLLLSVDDEESQQQALNQALEYLRAGAQASRAYIFRNIPDTDLGLCMGILAEACAQEIRPHIINPANQKYPWSKLPEEMFTALGAGNPYGGPVQCAFASTPLLLEAFLHQPQPLLSFHTLPLSLNDQWWGFIGFDDCETPREWDEDEILMLRTASEMIENTFRRWAAEKHLQETLEYLEKRVSERTVEFAQANAELKHEIYERQRFQDELQERLEIERTLANISTRLLSPLDLRTAIRETMADLGKIMQASRVVFIQLPDRSTDTVEEPIEWHAPGVLPVPNNRANALDATRSWVSSSLDSRKSRYLEGLPTQPGVPLAEMDLLFGSQVHALLLTPILLDKQLAGVIASISPKLPKPKILENIQTVEVVASMLASMLQRASLLNLLEEKISERTRELSAFFDMTMLSREAQEISDFMQPALAKVTEVSSSAAGLIHLLDSDKRELKLVALFGLPGELQSGLPTVLSDQTILEWMESIGAEVDSGRVTRPSTPDVFMLPRYDIAAYIPLRARGINQGLLSCYRQDDRVYNPYQISLLNAIGEQLGMAAESFRLRLKAEEAATIQERQRLARELHDAVSQSLYSLTLFARSGRDAFEVGDQKKLLDSLEQVESNSLAALKEMRLLLYQLRSLALEEGGLVRAIESRFNMVERRSGTQASVSIDESIQLSERVEQELFLLVTEALNNALKHAGASQVAVSIQPENEHIVTVVWNNGSSFDPSQAIGGMGLENMRQRAAALGGQLLISSQPGSGTWIRVEIPKL